MAEGECSNYRNVKGKSRRQLKRCRVKKKQHRLPVSTNDDDTDALAAACAFSVYCVLRKAGEEEHK